MPTVCDELSDGVRQQLRNIFGHFMQKPADSQPVQDVVLCMYVCMYVLVFLCDGHMYVLLYCMYSMYLYM